MRCRALLLFLLIPLLSCGSSADARLFVRLASGTGTNVMQAISNGMNTVYLGVYFEFRELKCDPASIYDYANPPGDPVLTYPSTSQPGLDPAQDNFKVDTSTLKTNAFYQVRMLAATVLPVATPPYEAISDCPLYIGLGDQNRVVLCFGVGGSAPRLCPGQTIPIFDNCPAPPSLAGCQS